MNENNNIADLVIVLPELFIALAGLVLLIAGVFRGNAGTAMLCWSVVAVLALSAIFLMGLDWSGQSVLNDMFILDHFAGFMKLLVITGLMASLALSVKYLQQENIHRFEYPLLILFAGLGMMIMLSAHNMLSLYVGLELQSLSLYVLASIQRDQLRSSEAGIKYFILGALASGMLLFGISMIYGFTGSISFSTIGQTLSAMPAISPALVIGMVFVIVGIAFKISAAPFHMWTPDVYEGAPTSVTALLAIVPKVAAIGLLMRLLFEPFGGIADQWQQVIWALSVLTMLVGAFAAIAQTNIKRLMAYSSIGHMGYAMIGIVAGNPAGAGSVIIYMMVYMIMSAGVFGVILTMRRNDIAAENISDLSGLAKNSPMMAMAMAILMFSMSGIPPLAGFFGKFFVFQAAVAGGYYTLAVIGVLSSVVAAFYYLRIIKVMYFDEETEPFDADLAFAKRAVIALSVVFVLFFIVRPSVLVQTSMSAASALFSG